MKLAQFKSPETSKAEPMTEKDWAKLVDKRNKRKGIAYSTSSKDA